MGDVDREFVVEREADGPPRLAAVAAFEDVGAELPVEEVIEEALSCGRHE